ncbi:hypothetical protein KQ304_06915 [Synechococcus sp. CS-1329]|nr:hypothetical protein [Synechococcus sp. CS-1329]
MRSGCLHSGPWSSPTGTVHPPARSNPVIVFLLLPTLLYNNAFRESRYPKYW